MHHPDSPRFDLDRRSLLQRLAMAPLLPAASLLAAHPATFAQANVTRLIVPFTPGASNDAIGRLVADAMGKRSGRAWIVENRPGAGSQMGTEYVVKAPPDGNTLLLGAASGLGVLPAIKPNTKYAVDKDFTYLARVATSPYAVVVNAQYPARDFAQLLAMAKAQPNTLRMGSAGVGALDYMAARLIESQLGVQMNIVPYKGMSPVLNDLLAGHIDAAIVSPGTIASKVTEGRVRALAVLDERRSALLPDMPTADELGYRNLHVMNWWGIAGPAKMPAAAVASLVAELQAVLTDPATRKSLDEKGYDLAPLYGDAFARFVQEDQKRWTLLARQASIVLTE